MKVYGEVMGLEVMAESYLINSITWFVSWQQLAAQENGIRMHVQVVRQRFKLAQMQTKAQSLAQS